MRLALHWQILVGMLIGAVLGLAINFGTSKRQTVLSENLPSDVESVLIADSPDIIRIKRTMKDESIRETVVDFSGMQADSLRTLDELKKKDPEAYKWFMASGQSWARYIGEGAHWLGNLFLRMLKMVAVPLIVTSLASGIMGLGQSSRFGAMFSRTLFYYLATSFLAIVTGLVAVNIVRPGINSNLSAGGAENAQADKDLMTVMTEQVEALVPDNPLNAFVSPNFLSIIAFTLLLAIFALRVGGPTLQRVQTLAEDFFQIIMRLTMAIIALAPIGVMMMMLHVTATQGAAVFQSLAWYMIAVVSALGFHAFVTLPLILYFVAGRNPLEFAKALSPALLTAFSSASSNGTLPLTLTSIENRGGVSNRVSSFVLPLGATINMDGTALYEAVAVLFIAQIYTGGDMTLTQQIVVAFTALLASVGAAGIPHAGLVMMTIILQAVNLPVELQGIILAVDRVLDMCRTSVNVWSDSCGAAVIQAWSDRQDAKSPPPVAEIPTASQVATT